MIIAFETELLRDICLRAEVAEQHFGSAVAESLFSILADIKAAQTADDLFLARILDGKNANLPKMQLDFGKRGVLELVSNHTKHNGPNASRVTWSQVKRIRIVEIFVDDC